MLRYGTDKPDLRNPIEIADVTEVFRGSGFKVFAGCDRAGGGGARGPGAGCGRPAAQLLRPDGGVRPEPGRARAWAGSRWATARPRGRSPSSWTPSGWQQLRAAAGLTDGDAVFFVCDQAGRGGQARRPGPHPGGRGARADRARTATGSAGSSTSRCTSGTRRPRPSPSRTTRSRCRRAGWRRCESQDPLTILAYQYDIVCNGIELSSGAIRNHRPDIMAKAFELAGYGPRGAGGEVRRHVPRAAVRRAAARRHRPRRGPDRDAAGGHAEPARGHGVPAVAAGRGAAAGRARGRSATSSSRSCTSSCRWPRGSGCARRRRKAGAEPRDAEPAKVEVSSPGAGVSDMQRCADPRRRARGRPGSGRRHSRRTRRRDR